MNSARHLVLALIAFVALVVLAACGARTTYVSIRHPLQVGGVDPNQVPFENTREERGRQIPAGTLVDSAQLLTLTPDQICIRVTLWADQLRPERANFAAYRIALLSDASDIENTAAHIQLEQASVMQYQGVRSETRVRGGAYGARVQRASYPFVWQITHQPATMCWPNGGFVTPSTTHMTLELSDAGAGNRINFEWDFTSSVAAPPPQ